VGAHTVPDTFVALFGFYVSTDDNSWIIAGQPVPAPLTAQAP